MNIAVPALQNKQGSAVLRGAAVVQLQPLQPAHSAPYKTAVSLKHLKHLADIALSANDN